MLALQSDAEATIRSRFPPGEDFPRPEVLRIRAQEMLAQAHCRLENGGGSG